ncbi:hypothetical protein [Winogradskyella sp. PE311]|uniref:hypothetical protein n=1 Tax=Winogradskyella sp. PE311 TaxID=3366943 RepID=UPI00397FEBEC
MRLLILTICLTFFTNLEVFAQTKFTLKPSQSMILTGKGPGQDGTKNPYFGEDCYAIVKNIGETKFSIRIQQNGKIIREITFLKGELKKVKLLKEHELYIDPNDKGISKASIDYQKINNKENNSFNN